MSTRHPRTLSSTSSSPSESHTEPAQELWESTTSSSATVTYSESHTQLRSCGNRLHHHQLLSLIQSLTHSSGAVGVDYIIISYCHLFRVSHTAQELWESTTSSSATVTYSESHTQLRSCGSRLHHHQLRSPIQSLTHSSGAVGVDYIIISCGHLFRVSHTAQELWESTTSSSATVTYSESHTELRSCGSRGGRPGVPVRQVFFFFFFFFFVDVKHH